MSWQPIETAPKDGTRMLLCEFGSFGDYDAEVSVGMWSPGAYGDAAEPFWANWHTDLNLLESEGLHEEWDRLVPTHWQPLPDPPA